MYLIIYIFDEKAGKIHAFRLFLVAMNEEFSLYDANESAEMKSTLIAVDVMELSENVWVDMYVYVCASTENGYN